MAHTKKVIRSFMKLDPKDIDGRYFVEVTITPDVQDQAKMMRAQLAQSFRTPGPNGMPLFDDLTIITDIIEHPNATLILKRVAEQMLAAKSQEINKVQTAAAEQGWLDDNKDLVELADKRLNPEGLPPIKPEQVKMMMDFFARLQQGADPAMLQAMMQEAAGAPPQLPGAPGGGGAPGGPHPAVMPAQFTMTQEEALPVAATLPGKQAQRGRAQNK